MQNVSPPEGTKSSNVDMMYKSNNVRKLIDIIASIIAYVKKSGRQPKFR
jgi:hypothetical protein